jgi:prepilin-type N-terminal cleavage/methylation domain-containing protein/prepilin-type processing-associated H-X9-DG protein
MQQSHPRNAAFTLVELLVVIGIIGILVALLLPAVQQAREAGRNLACKNNIRQLGLSIHLFHDVNGVFPASGWTRSGPGNPAGMYVGWRALTLPYMEQSNLHRLYDFNLNWWEQTNAVTASVPVPVFRCASTPDRPEVLQAVAKPPRPAVTFSNPIAPTDYEAIMGVQPNSINPHLSVPIYNAGNRFSIMSRNSRSKFADVIDGTTHTAAIVECGGRPTVFRRRTSRPDLSNDQGIGWADSEGPFSLDGSTATGDSEGCGPSGGCVQAMNARNDNEPYSFHNSASNILYVDGRVQSVSETVDLITFAKQCTMSAND